MLSFRRRSGSGENGPPLSSEPEPERRRFLFCHFFLFWYHIAVLPSGNGGDLIYGKMVSKGSSPGNHGGGLRILSREHEVRLKDCAPVAATVLSGPNITW
jgi:hypothetical protein